MEVDATHINRFDVPDDLMREMRSSIVFLGAIAARMHSARADFRSPAAANSARAPLICI